MSTQANKTKKILLSETENEDTEKVIMPTRHFQAIIQSKDSAYEQSYREGVQLSSKLKAEGAKTAIYLSALEKEQREKETLKASNKQLEKELSIHKSKTKSSPEIEKMLLKMKEGDNYMAKNKQNLIEDHYKKNYASEVENLKKTLGVE